MVELIVMQSQLSVADVKPASHGSQYLTVDDTRECDGGTLDSCNPSRHTCMRRGYMYMYI